MTTQAKNHLLYYTALTMLAIIMVSIFQFKMYGETPHGTPATVLIPKEQPVLVSVVKMDRMVVSGAPYDMNEFECMRLNLFHEARNQGRKGMEAVALVTLNRTKTKHYPSTVCGVVKQAVVRNGAVVRNKCQFSWYCDGKDDFPNLRHPGDRQAWELASNIAEAALMELIPDFLGRSTHYHATYVNPRWANVPSRYKRLTKVGTHIFYRDIKLGLKG